MFRANGTFREWLSELARLEREACSRHGVRAFHLLAGQSMVAALADALPPQVRPACPISALDV